MKKIYCLMAVLFVSACAQFEPFIDARREAGQLLMQGQSTPDVVAICYNPIWSDMNDVEKLAKEGCAQTKRTPQYDDKKYFTCSLFTPTTAFYRCI